jgi:putative hydrolase of the HAD superfamily
MIKAIIFDFDGLILDTETVWYHSFREALAPYQVEFPLEVFSSFVGTHGSEFDAYLERQAGALADLQAVKRTASERHREKIKQMDAREGVREFLTEAKAGGLRIGLASSSDRKWVEGFLRELELLPYFEVVKTQDDVAKVKPDPELYLQALEALNVRPDEALAFEDSAAGAKAAKAAGMHCVIVPNPVTEHLLFDDYDLRIESMAKHTLSEIIGILRVGQKGG